MHWQVQEAKQRFSELIRYAHDDGAQFVTRHGEEVAVVIDINEYRKITGRDLDFKEFLRSAPDFGALDIVRSDDLARRVEFGFDQ